MSTAPIRREDKSLFGGHRRPASNVDSRSEDFGSAIRPYRSWAQQPEEPRDGDRRRPDGEVLPGPGEFDSDDVVLIVAAGPRNSGEEIDQDAAAIRFTTIMKPPPPRLASLPGHGMAKAAATVASTALLPWASTLSATSTAAGAPAATAGCM